MEALLQLIPMILGKNNSPAWNRISGAMNTFNSGKALWQKFNTGV